MRCGAVRLVAYGTVWYTEGMRKVLVPLIVALVGCLASTAEARTPRPTVLVMPGGAWVRADPAMMRPQVDALRARGYRARAITYPLGSPLKAIRYVETYVRRIPGPVILYGLSAGGTIAAALAAKGEVAGAVDMVGPTDLLRWTTPFGLATRVALHRSRQELKDASPYWRLNGRQSPQLVVCGRYDTYVPCRQSAAYVRAARQGQRDTNLLMTLGEHEDRPSDTLRAVSWIARRWAP